MNYNYKKERKYAFVIANDKVYKGKYHHMACIYALSDGKEYKTQDEKMNIEMDIMRNFSEEELFEQVENQDCFAIGEVGMKDGKEFIVTYDLDFIFNITNYFPNMDVYLYFHDEIQLVSEALV